MYLRLRLHESNQNRTTEAQKDEPSSGKEGEVPRLQVYLSTLYPEIELEVGLLFPQL